MSTAFSLDKDQILEVLSLSKNATAIYVTNDIIIQSANDAMIAFWGRDRSVIGKPLAEAVPELQGQPFIKMLQDVLRTGITDAGEAIRAELLIDGKLQTFYYDYEYRAIKNKAGEPYCILHTATDVTEKALNRAALQQAKERQEAQTKALAESEQNLRLIILQAPVAIAIFRGPDYVLEIANKRALELWGREMHEVKGKPILDTIAELQSQGIKEILDKVYTTGKPFAATELQLQLIRQGRPETAYLNFIYEPLYNSEGIINGLITIGTEVTSQVLARREIKESEVRYRQAVESGNLGTWSIDIKTLGLVISERFREILGFSNEGEVTIQQFLAQIEPDYVQAIRDSLNNAIAFNKATDIEYPVTNLITQERKWVRATGKLFFDEHGNGSHFSGMMMDITERKLDDIRKNDFIGMVSHELKTPLTSLTAYVQVLNNRSKKSGDEFTIGMLDKANIQVRKMSNMINSFLNISRLETGKIYLDMLDFDLNKLVAEMIAESQVMVSTHTITLISGQRAPVHADRDKIASVISNLLSNAVKYSPKGKLVNVNCEVNDNTAQFSVSDEGMGIKPHDIEKLFNRYYRVETNHTQHISGFGIGLYLSSEIINRHNGKIWVESESGVGSTFYFSLPLAGKE